MFMIFYSLEHILLWRWDMGKTWIKKYVYLVTQKYTYIESALEMHILLIQ